MTPLAHRIVKELTLPKRQRTLVDPAGLLPRLSDIHCFEVSAVLPIARELAAELLTDPHPLEAFGGLAFLPAPKTWIEWSDDEGRVGFLLEEMAGGRMAAVSLARAETFDSLRVLDLPLDGNPDTGTTIYVGEQCHDNNIGAAIGYVLYALLTMINQPRRINQRVHMPHAGLQKKLAAKFTGIGGYPLHAYRELTLKVGAPVDATNAEAWTDYLSNRMPLHFVRAHRRRADGVNNSRYDQNDYSTWDLIPACWRGTSALGIKRTRYRLEPAEAA